MRQLVLIGAGLMKAINLWKGVRRLLCMKFGTSVEHVTLLNRCLIRPVLSGSRSVGGAVAKVIICVLGSSLRTLVSSLFYMLRRRRYLLRISARGLVRVSRLMKVAVPGRS